MNVERIYSIRNHLGHEVGSVATALDPIAAYANKVNAPSATFRQGHTVVELKGIEADVLAYITSLKSGEKVIETGESCMKGKKGVVYLKLHAFGRDKHDVCVMWEGKMGTSVTWGTRRVTN